MFKVFLAAIFAGVLTACEQQTSSSSAPSAQGRWLYVASGGCYGGGVPLSTGSATIVKYDAVSGAFGGIVFDYNTASPGDVPASITNYDANYLLVAVENTGGRRIDLVSKNGSGYQTYLTNTNLNGVLRSIVRLSDGSILVSKSTGIEKFNSGKSRVTSGANPFISNPTPASCATTNTLISSVAVASNGKILYSHAGASPNNKMPLVSGAGYSGTGDCLAGQSAPVATALPTSTLIHTSGLVLTSYGSTTASSNSVYAYNLDISTNVFSNATQSFFDSSIVNGPSAIVEDIATGAVFVANANSNYNNIEKFSVDVNSKTLTRATSTPFVPQSIFTRCISSLLIAN